MRFDVGHKIFVRNPTRELLDWCRENLTIENPEYYKKQSMGKWLGNTPEYIWLYEKNGDTAILPFGCVESLMKAFKGYGFFTLIGARAKFDYKSRIKLYDYQKDAVECALRRKNGVIVMPCGAGKTQTGLELIARVGVKTLWLTHTQDLLNQSMNRAKSVFDCGGYGTITGGKVNIGQGITFATIQTMSRLDLGEYRNEWGMVVVDECHKAIGSPTKVMQFYKVISNLSCRYKIGLTATPKRADGLEKSMFALIGGIICEVDKKAVADTTCRVEVRSVETGYMPDLDMALAGDGTVNYAGLVDDLIHNKERFEIVSQVINDIPKGSPALVLANRVEYLKKLCEAYKGRSKCLSLLGSSKTAKAERKKALADLNSGNIDCLFATYQLAKEGLDVPNLRYVVFSTPEKDETTVMQSVGRVSRKAEGKEKGMVIDFIDSFGMFMGWARKRAGIYRKLGLQVLT